MPLAFFFLAPMLFAAGAACVSIPIIIHLLNKRKFKTIVWAAMDFLLAAQRRNARKLKFRRWLLLATRCLALLLLAAGIAQLVAQNTVFGNFASGQKAYVVVWDDSYSMAFTPAGNTAPSAFDKSKRALLDWIPTLGPADKIMVIRASRGGTTANGASNNRPSPDKDSAKARIAAALPSDASTDLSAALDQAADALKELGPTSRTRQLLILTDASNSALRDPSKANADPAAGAVADRLKKSLAAAKAQATDTRLFDFGAPDQPNMAVTDLRPVHPLVVAGTRAEFRITVLNATDRPAVDVPLSILVDGVPAHAEKLTRIDPGSPRTLTIAVPLATAGRHTIEARLPADGLPVDDGRTLLLNVRREIPILLVDGSPGDNHTLGSTTYLQVAFALSAGDKPGSLTPAALGGGFAPRVITELELPTTALPPFAAVVLSDTTTPRAPAVRDALRKYVQEGGLLLIFPGGHTNAQDMNALLGAPGVPSAPGVDPLLPAAIGQAVKTQTAGELQTGTPFAPEGYTHPVLEKFGEAAKSGLDVGFSSVQTTQYLKLTPPADGSSEVILRYAKPDGAPGDPAVVARQVGKGKVVLFASTADTAWNSFGAAPSYVPFVHELMYYAIPGDTDALTLRVGDSIHLPQDLAPAGAWNGPRNTSISVTTEIKDGRPRLTSGPLAMAGRYAPASATDGRPVVVVNPDAADEADIRHVNTAALATALGIDASLIDPAPRNLSPQQSNNGDKAPQGADLARSLLLTALCFFLLETLLARLFSVYR
jgi:hypothetical protein